VTFVALRVYTRAFIVRNMGLEDWTMVSAAVLTVVFLVQFVFSIKEYGVGAHTASVTMEQSVSGIKVGLGLLFALESLNSPH
jgi:hypothetical protein